MKSAKRLNRKLVKSRLTKKKRQVGRGDPILFNMTYDQNGRTHTLSLKISGKKIDYSIDNVDGKSLRVIEGIKLSKKNNRAREPIADYLEEYSTYNPDFNKNNDIALIITDEFVCIYSNNTPIFYNYEDMPNNHHIGIVDNLFINLTNVSDAVEEVRKNSTSRFKRSTASRALKQQHAKHGIITVEPIFNTI